MSVAFISYSRRDKAFVQRLYEGFKALDRDIWVDWEDIPLTSDWRSEIRDGIEKADNFIFVVSPDSARSVECRYEVETAVETHKRIIPIVYRDVTGDDYGALHPIISSHNWIFCRDEKESFDEVFGVVIKAIDTDLNYIKEHTRLLVRAREWDAKKRDASRLLTGSEITAAEHWLANSHSKKPDATELHSEFIFASRQRASRVQQALLTAASVALVIVAVLGVVAVWQAFVARREAAEARSLEIAANSQVAIISNNYDLAIALGMESNGIDNPPNESQQILAQGAFAAGTRAVFDQPANIRSVAASQDGTLALMGTASGDLLIWGLSSGEQQGTLVGHTAAVNEVVTHPGSAPEALSAGQDGQLIRWNLVDNTQVAVYTVEDEGSPVAVRSVDYHPDGTRAIAGYENGLTVVWDLETGEEIVRYEDHPNPVREVDFSRDGQLFASGDATDNDGEDGRVVIRSSDSAPEDEPVATYTEPGLLVRGLAFSPSGEDVLVGTASGSVGLFTIETQTMGSPFAAAGSANSHSAPVWKVDFSEDGHLAVSVSGDTTMKLWFVDTGTLFRSFSGHTGSVRAVTFIPGQTRALSGGNDATVRYWDLFSYTEVQRYYGAENDIVSGVQFGADDATAYVSAWDGVVRWYDVETGRPRGQFEAMNRITVMARHPETGSLLLGGRQPNLLLYNPADDSTVTFLEDYTEVVEAVAISPDGTRGVSGDVNGLIAVWDLATGEKLDEFPLDGEYISALAYNPNGTQIAAASRTTGSIFLIDLNTREQRTLEGHAPVQAYAVDYSPDGTQIATGGGDNLIILWNVADGSRVRSLAGHTSLITETHYNADGTRLYSGGGDDAIRLWDPATGEQLYSWQVRGTGSSTLYRIAVSADGARVLVSGYDRIARLVETSPLSLEDLLAYTRANRYIPALTCAQQDQYRITVEGSDC